MFIIYVIYDGVEINIVYQPKFCLIKNRLSGLEALTRASVDGLSVDHENTYLT